MGLIFQKRVPLCFRSDAAKELIDGVVSTVNQYLGIDHVSTGGYNPKANAMAGLGVSDQNLAQALAPRGQLRWLIPPGNPSVQNTPAAYEMFQGDFFCFFLGY